MLAYIVRRALAAIPVMVVVGVVVFLLIHLTPGDAADVLSDEDASAEEVEMLREALGLNRPMHEQFLIWSGRILQGDLGKSIVFNQPVTVLMGQRLEPTLSLAATTILFAVAVGIPLGVLAAWRAGSLVDRAVMVFAVLGFSIPGFWLGFIFIFELSVNWGLFPAQGYVGIREGIVPFLHHMILPTVTLGLVYVALITRITRATVLEVLKEDYIRTAYAKGVPPGRVLFKHALRNASVPIVTIIGIGIALLLNGVVVIETVFNLPGLGSLTIDAILNRDYPVVQGVILVFSGVYVLVNLAVDISYSFFDPRVRH